MRTRYKKLLLEYNTLENKYITLLEETVKKDLFKFKKELQLDRYQKRIRDLNKKNKELKKR